ncbi:hypothetical protein ACFLZ8_02515 [Planctomycetota bacterium]
MKEIFIQILWSLGAYLIILKVSINLIGLVVRGLLDTSPSIPDEASPQLTKIFKTEIRKNKQANILMTFISIILTIAFFYALFHFWNIGLAVIAGIIMVAYLPDLLWEIKTGKRVSKTNMPPWKFISNLSVLIMLLCLPLTWYCLFRLN